MDSVKNIRAGLFALQDKAYRDFHAALIPTVDKESIIGVRTPALRAYAKGLSASEAAEFLSSLPHQYYDENTLHGFLIERIGDRADCLAQLERFLPYIDNWATCDMVRPAIFKKAPPEPTLIRRWMSSEHTYTVRYGIGMLISYYMRERFDPSQSDDVAALRSEEYYIRIMCAWYFATALTWQYERALPYIEQRRLDNWTHNKAIQKAVESRMIPAERKQYLRTLRLK